MSSAALTSKKTRLASDGSFTTELTSSDQALQFLFAYVDEIEAKKIKVGTVVRYANTFQEYLNVETDPGLDRYSFERFLCIDPDDWKQTIAGYREAIGKVSDTYYLTEYLLYKFHKTMPDFDKRKDKAPTAAQKKQMTHDVKKEYEKIEKENKKQMSKYSMFASLFQKQLDFSDTELTW